MGEVDNQQQATPGILHVVPRSFGFSAGVFGDAERYVHELARFLYGLLISAAHVTGNELFE